jgi:DNA polymerase I-like protein with 3'-5' exonuclease and polymerase domains
MFTPEYAPLQNVIGLTNSLCPLLAKIYCRGFYVNKETLQKVRTEFQTEREELLLSLGRQTATLMGDTPVNLSSPEQLSAVIYSRKPKDKGAWSTRFSKYMKQGEFTKADLQGM